MNGETTLLFGPQHAQVGILHAPPAAPTGGGTLAVVFINAGLIHHIGPNRLHVRLARALAADGIASLRIDLSGIGDSPPRADHLSIYELVRREPREAMDALAQRGFQRFILVGLCSGAYSAFHVACEDPRVAAAVMINPEDLSLDGSESRGADERAAWARRYWTLSLFRPRAWLNLLSGRVNYRRLLATLSRQLRSAPAPEETAARSALRSRVLQALHARRLELLFMSSGDDVSREYLELVFDAATVAQAPAGTLQREVLEDCDHLFTRLEDQRRLVAWLVPWAARLAGDPR
jgi:pimeloyl-ACP methyl ester carboxylesterase